MSGAGDRFIPFPSGNRWVRWVWNVDNDLKGITRLLVSMALAIPGVCLVGWVLVWVLVWLLPYSAAVAALAAGRYFWWALHG